MFDPSQSSNDLFSIYNMAAAFSLEIEFPFANEWKNTPACSSILIFRSDNLVDFLPRFLIVNRPCEPGPLESLSHNAIMRVYEPFHKISGRSTLSEALW